MCVSPPNLHFNFKTFFSSPFLQKIETQERFSKWPGGHLLSDHADLQSAFLSIIVFLEIALTTAVSQRGFQVAYGQAAFGFDG